MRISLRVCGCVLCVASLFVACSRGVCHTDIDTPNGVLRLTALDENAVRVQLVKADALQLDELVYLPSRTKSEGRVEQTAGGVTFALPGIKVTYDVKNDALSFADANGTLLLSEAPGGRRIVVSEVQGEKCYAVSQTFVSPTDEHLYGTGQFQDGHVNVRGLTRRLTQVNTQIALPMTLSSKGYALLWNNYGLVDYNPSSDTLRLEATEVESDGKVVDVTGTAGNRRERRVGAHFEGVISVGEDGDYSIQLDVGQRMARRHTIAVDGETKVDIQNIWLPPTTSFITHLAKGEHRIAVEGNSNDRPLVGWRRVGESTEWSSPVAAGIDYTVFAGKADEAIAGYRRVTGAAPMMPRWALGYIHCRERYDTQKELLANAAEFRQRGIPSDVIVQDWQWWGKHGWNAMRFDEDKYPAPADMVDSLHKMDFRLMLSVWAKIDRQCELGRSADSKGFYIPGTDWIDFFNPAAADFYWDAFRTRLLMPYGIDAWWQDATEPENDDLFGRRVMGGRLPGEFLRNAFPLFVNSTVYGGLRSDAPGRRPMILTRCAFPGQQRFAAATWSGDVGHDWQTLRLQIAAGLGQMAAGIPWWTFDAGGFFRPFDQHSNKDYQEVMLRWVQTAVFLPLMRTHGYMSQTEPWRYGAEAENLFRRSIETRRALLPYIYSQSARVWREGYTLMRPLVMDFPTDEEALRQECEYMFGQSLLVAPIVAPAVKEWRVYLPAGCQWFDFWGGAKYEGGRYVDVEVAPDRVPVFVRSGSVIPMYGAKAARQNINALSESPVTLLVFAGADADFTLYDDDGVSNDYEKGSFATVAIHWDEKGQKLTIGDRKGGYDKMPANRRFNVARGDAETSVDYNGSKVVVE